MRIVVTGGGSAGHITPILAVAESLRTLDPQVELLYIGQADSMEERIARASDLDFAVIKSGKFRRLHGVSLVNKLLNPATLGMNARDIGRVAAGVVGSLRILRGFRPDVVFVKGGFVGLPVGLAAKMLGLPYVIHESDVSPGLTNRILSRWAARIAVGFPKNSYRVTFDAARVTYVGNLVRAELSKAHRLEGLAKFNLSDKLPVILVTGGSLGAVALNDAILGALRYLLPKYQVLHITGDLDLERIKFEVGRMKPEHANRYHVFGFLMGEMASALAAADVVVARAGANTIAELATLGKPTVLIPNYLMAGHQSENARMLARAGAARVIDEVRLTPRLLAGEIDMIMESPEEQKQLSESIRQYARPDAARDLAQLILDVGRERGGGGGAGGGGNAAPPKREKSAGAAGKVTKSTASSSNKKNKKKEPTES